MLDHPPHRFSNVLVIRDVVAIKDRSGLMSRDLLSYDLGDPSPNQVSKRRPTEIVKELGVPVYNLSIANPGWASHRRPALASVHPARSQTRELGRSAPTDLAL